MSRVTWSERLWLPGSCFLGAREHERLGAWPRLWLLLSDGRVLVFALYRGAPNDRHLDALTAAVADDLRGDLLDIPVDAPNPASFFVLHGAPASPMLCVAPDNPLLAEAMLFHAALDAPVLAALQRMVGEFTFWASSRNYNRLAAHAQRERRLQALQRFPLLVAPILLTHQRWFNVDEAKRYRWRAHDPVVVAAIEQGRDLVGALADYYGISRGLVRSSFCAHPWVGHCGLSLGEFLKFLDAMPANRRPASGEEVKAFAEHLPALWGLFEPQTTLAAAAFRSGYSELWCSLRLRFTPLNASLMDATDFLNALLRWLRATHRIVMGRGELAGLWVRARGLRSLLEASRRWHHRLPPRRDKRDTRLPDMVPKVLGSWCTSDGTVRAMECETYSALADEGESMHHCVADYWSYCAMYGARVFSLRQGQGRGDNPLALDGVKTASSEALERATAFYELKTGRYVLSQLRGPRNVGVSETMQQAAEGLAKALNSDALVERRRVAEQEAEIVRCQPAGKSLPPVLDPGSIATVTTLLAQLRAD